MKIKITIAISQKQIDEKILILITKKKFEIIIQFSYIIEILLL